MSLLEVRDLGVVFPGRRGTVHAVNGVSLRADSGETIGIVGETGCGKSSLVRALVGLLPPPGRVSTGTVEFDGKNLLALGGADLRQVRATGIAFMPQNSFAALNPVVRVDEQFIRVLGIASGGGSNNHRQRLERARDLLRQVGLSEPQRVLTSYPHHLSGGMAQRVVIALTMIRNPRIVIADEPTTGLDVTILRQIMDLLARLRQERGSTLLLVTHALAVVAEYCTRVMVMYGGQVVEVGPVQSVFGASHHPYTRALLGAMPRRGDELAIIPGTVSSLYEHPTACVFRARCQVHSDPRCDSERPPLRQVAADHFVATFCEVGEA
jgi:oligopeptide/dipeptide ABC transporter ATP-binding protein